MDCTTAMSLKTSGLPSNDITLSYAAGTTDEWNSVGWMDIFVNADAVNCPITLCALKSGDCSTSFTSSHISILSGTTKV